MTLRSRLRRLREERRTSIEAARARADDERMWAILPMVLRSDSCCIDVGANIGSVLERLVRLAPAGRHIAYEPIPHLAERLRVRFPTVDVRCAALSNRTGTTDFVHVISDPAYSGFLKRVSDEATVETIEVRVEAIDDSLPPGYAPSLIKIDVEGAEEQVIEGALRTLATHRPFVLFEHGIRSASLYGTTSGRIHDLLCGEAGLHIYELGGRGPLSKPDFEDLFNKPVWNYVACSREVGDGLR